MLSAVVLSDKVEEVENASSGDAHRNARAEAGVWGGCVWEGTEPQGYFDTA